MTYVKTAVIVLIIAMTLSVVLTYASIMTIANTTKENTQRVLDSFIMENSTEIYQSIKNGNHEMTHNEFDERFKELVAQELKLETSESMLYNENVNKNIIFSYTNPLTTNLNDDDTLELKTNFNLIIPINFAGQKLFDLFIPLEVKSLYVLKY